MYQAADGSERYVGSDADESRSFVGVPVAFVVYLRLIADEVHYVVVFADVCNKHIEEIAGCVINDFVRSEAFAEGDVPKTSISFRWEYAAKITYPDEQVVVIWQPTAFAN